ncbi:MAG: hypothetical protein RR313_10020 [Anaerovoracaceae bacterium]
MDHILMALSEEEKIATKIGRITMKKKIMLSVLIIAVLAIGCIFALVVNSKAKLINAITGAEITFLNYGSFPTQTGLPQDLTEEERNSYLQAYKDEIAKYYSTDTPAGPTYIETKQRLLNMTLAKVSYTVDAGVSSCKIKNVEYNDNQTEATVSADVISWAKFVDEKDNGFVIYTPKDKTQYVFEMKKEDDTWKVHKVKSMDKVKSIDIVGLNDANESNAQSNDAIEVYSTFAEAKSAALQINMD